MTKRCLILLAIALLLSASGCGKSTEDEAAPIDEAALVAARVEMHGNRVCGVGGSSAELVDRFRMGRITITDATLQTFPDPQGPTLNPGGPLNNYCWWLVGTDCPAAWYGDEKLEFPAGSDLQGETSGLDLDARCRQWLETEAGVDIEEVVAVSLYQEGWMSMGYDGYDDGSYPVYVALVPTGLLQDRNQANVANCSLRVLGATEAGDSNTVFAYVESLEFGL